MTARAHVEYAPSLMGLRIQLAERHPDGSVIVAQFADVEMVYHPNGEVAIDNPKPLRLTEDQARALYEALARHFGGAPDMAQLRADYQDERRRVDRLIGYHQTIAEAISQRAPS